MVSATHEAKSEINTSEDGSGTAKACQRWHTIVALPIGQVAHTGISLPDEKISPVDIAVLVKISIHRSQACRVPRRCHRRPSR